MSSIWINRHGSIMCYCKWEHARERSISLEWVGRSQAIESSLVESIWVYPKIVFLASLGSRGQDSTQFGSRIFWAILIFRMKLSAIDWIDGTSIHSIPLCGTESHSSHFLLGLRCHVWNKITPNWALFNTCLGKSKINTQFWLPSRLTPVLEPGKL